MSDRKALDTRAMGLMVFFCAILGMQQVVIKAAAADMLPMMQIAIRSGIAALIIGLYLRLRGLGLCPERRVCAAGLIAGILFTLEYVFVAEGLRFTTASHMVTLLYTAPAFAALGLHVRVAEERLRPLQWAGMALAFLGIVIAFSRTDNALVFSGAQLWGDFLGLLAGMSWGATTVIIRTRLSTVPASQTAFIQLLVCTLVLIPVAAMRGGLDFSMTGIVWVSLGFQSLIVCAVGMLLWFWMLTVYPASQLGALSFLTPVFGIVFGVLLLGESLEPRFMIGAILVLAGIVLVSGGPWFRQQLHFGRKAEKPRY